MPNSQKPMRAPAMIGMICMVSEIIFRCTIDIGITGLATSVKNWFDARHGHARNKNLWLKLIYLKIPCSRKRQNDLRKL